ncbi:hypothetical protein G647_01584 [Cladophialophora carrionii CBS 160.54]|uniref:Nascent polypeptide-associated complex subunit alpha-like UBA domain-containing protein n=2 Tax=Cladophialophora carrionii TaxID=86049 RepID=A0A1C1CEB3_9EURO|nr:uncharacterized protein G647_01584 [Cladophialophora carrionii CBS 160.54]ETI29131.1 hypothetical protein G647_01584 [Cladophialophora carrionii CBS 160.54]OCT46875.1 hypothetical protein CLCR_02140 [Cladophialophora carrionii]
MAEPVPSASAAAADAADDEASQNLPKNAEDRKAAVALNSLNANEMSTDNGETGPKQPSAADQEALGKAMSRLEIASGVSKKKEDPTKAETKKEIEVKKKIKIAAEDVNFLVEELDLSKNKATELLRSHDGNASLAIKAFITPAVGA